MSSRHKHHQQLALVSPDLHLVSAGLVSEQKSQAAEAGASCTEAPPLGCHPSSQGAVGGRASAGVQHFPAVLSSASGSLTPPFLGASVRSVFPPPRPSQPVSLPWHPTLAEAARGLVQPAEE